MPFWRLKEQQRIDLERSLEYAKKLGIGVLGRNIPRSTTIGQKSCTPPGSRVDCPR